MTQTKISWQVLNHLREQRLRLPIKDVSCYRDARMLAIAKRMSELQDEVVRLESVIFEYAIAEEAQEKAADSGVVVIDMHLPTAVCCMCGVEHLNRQGIPVSSQTGQIVGNGFEGDWGGKPACAMCHRRHADGEFDGEYPKF